MGAHGLEAAVVELQPGPGPGQDQDRVSESSAERGHAERQPVVILLGWAGCQDKYLAKYSAIYSQKGCTVIRYTAPWRMIFFSESFGIKSLQTPARRLLELLFHYRVEDRPVLFHVFSNGGVMLYRYIIEALRTHKPFQNLRVAGTIFDSTPGRRNLVGALRALAIVLVSMNVLLKYFLLLTFATGAVVLRVLLYPLTRFVHESHYDALLKAPSRWPELYLYSQADAIIKASEVKHMADTRQQLGVPVKAVDFSDSPHVSHMRVYPTYYSSLCVTFLSDCVQGSPP
ncbi:PREDICTED: transmembrane protein 53 [Lepidothrix coronata]|uniref:Transmembrane protein 53 n=1 Tax=Lepidothrix coronata TaxID=321398 RepID=A0A6J0I2M0_9PASS|nr:PREDICTED: transmembrane protein 53 [Lepidothrix coronata]